MTMASVGLLLLSQSHLVFLLLVASSLVWLAGAQDTWCGKVYNGSAQIIPGGALVPPEQASNPMLDVQVIPRHSIYVASEDKAELIVDAALSYLHGAEYSSSDATGKANDDGDTGNEAPSSDSLDFTINIQGTEVASGTVPINTTDNLVSFDLSKLSQPPNATASFPIELTGQTTRSRTNYSATAELFYLPDPTTGASVVKIDRLYGSLLYRNNATSGAFTPYFPYGFYGSYSGYFNATGNPTAFRDLGFNALNPVADFTDTDLTTSLDEMDGLDGLLWQYDMRGSYQNLTSVAAQVPLVKDRPSLLTYYTADEPDGWSYPLNSTVDAYRLLADLDKYHPTALVLNCQNYYYREYTAGADIIMEDAYPIGINSTYTTRWNTTVNATYGDCGCDNCNDSLGVLNVPSRIEDLKQYAVWIGAGSSRKPIWAVPQAFSGEGYWARDPTPAETWAMDLLAFNHGAKGRLAWLYPPSATLGNATAQLAKVVTVPPVRDYLTGANPALVSDGLAGNGTLDVACWVRDGTGVLVGVANPVDAASAAPVRVGLPKGLNVSRIAQRPWGNVTWTLDGTPGDGFELVAGSEVVGHATSYVILE